MDSIAAQQQRYQDSRRRADAELGGGGIITTPAGLYIKPDPASLGRWLRCWKMPGGYITAESVLIPPGYDPGEWVDKIMADRRKLAGLPG